MKVHPLATVLILAVFPLGLNTFLKQVVGTLLGKLMGSLDVVPQTKGQRYKAPHSKPPKVLNLKGSVDRMFTGTYCAECEYLF